MGKNALSPTLSALTFTTVSRAPRLAKEQMPIASNPLSPYLATRLGATRGRRNEKHPWK